MADASYQPGVYRKQGGNELVVAATGTLTVESGGTVAIASGGILTGNPARRTAKSVWFNLDNGSGVTVDDVIIKNSKAITLVGAKIVYVDATTGTVAAATVSLGTTVGGVDLVAATAYENTKAVGVSTALVLASAAVAANTAVFVRHTGVAATAAGQAYVEIEYTIDA